MNKLIKRRLKTLEELTNSFSQRITRLECSHTSTVFVSTGFDSYYFESCVSCGAHVRTITKVEKLEVDKNRLTKKIDDIDKLIEEQKDAD